MHSLVDRRALLVGVDASTALAAVFAGIWIRFGSATLDTWHELGLPPIWMIASSFAVLTFVSFAAAGVYRSEMYWDLRSEFKDLARGLILLAFVSLAFLFLFKLVDVSRIAITLALGLLASTTIVSRLLVRASARKRARRGHTLRNWVVVGTGEHLEQVSTLLRSNSHVGAGIVGFVTESSMSPDIHNWLGTVHDLPDILRYQVVDEVIVLGLDDKKSLEAVLSVCAEQGKTVRLSLDSIAPAALRGRMEEYGGIPMWSILSTPEHSLELAIKRLADIVGASLCLIILSPALLGLSLIIRLVDGNPILYRQARGGLHGREFIMLKFRTMVNGAEDAKLGLAHLNERNGPVFKLRDDPRVTRLGRWLRQTSLDETPQLFNVLIGHMSLVGPRPQPLEEVAAYDLWHRKRLSMRPGITGLWQIRARHDSSFDTWMDNDLEYIDRWSLWLDASILLRTPRALVRTPGT